MTDINRRALIGIAGAGLLLGSCGKRPIKKEINESESCGDVVDAVSDCEDYGQLVTEDAPDQGGYTAASFTPDHICVVYIKYEGGAFKIRHAYWEAAAKEA
ncbi:MAG: hypothetical protein ABI810_02390 [Sphingomonas bacterium]